MSDTPRTDKAIDEMSMQDLDIGHKLRETRELARSLERDLERERKAGDALQKELNDLKVSFSNLRKEFMESLPED